VPVSHWQGFVKYASIREIAHGKTVQPLNRAELLLPFVVFALCIHNANLAREHDLI
jgi:hypothetical protein